MYLQSMPASGWARSSRAFTTAAIKDDPDDNRVLQAAVEGEVDYIVSGDRDLLGLGEYANIPIVTPARFVAVLRTGLG
jgi:uncharacterized protein